MTSEIVYQEHAKVAAVFWEWRHKVMTFCFSGSVALVAMAGWVINSKISHRWMAIPLAMGILLSLASLSFDRRNVRILLKSFEVMIPLEASLVGEKGSVFSDIYHSHQREWWKRFGTYTFTLRVAYLLIGGMFSIGTALSLLGRL